MVVYRKLSDMYLLRKKGALYYIKTKKGGNKSDDRAPFLSSAQESEILRENGFREMTKKELEQLRQILTSPKYRKMMDAIQDKILDGDDYNAAKCRSQGR